MIEGYVIPVMVIEKNDVLFVGRFIAIYYGPHIKQLTLYKLK